MDAANATETAEKATTRTVETTNTLLPDLESQFSELGLVTHMNTRIGKNDKVVNTARKVFRIGSNRI